MRSDLHLTGSCLRYMSGIRAGEEREKSGEWDACVKVSEVKYSCQQQHVLYLSGVAMRRVELLLAIPVVLAGCGHETASQPRVGALVDTIDYRTTKGSAIQVAEVARYSGMRGELTPIDKLRSMVVMPDGGVAVQDVGTPRIAFFGPNAEPLGAFGREGGGPGEFRGIFGIGLLGDTVWAGDSRQDRATLIGPDRQLVRVISLPKVKGQDNSITALPPIKVLLRLRADDFIGLIPDGEQLFRANLKGEWLNAMPQAPSGGARQFQIGNTIAFASLFPSRPQFDVSADGRLVAMYDNLVEGSIAPATAVTVLQGTGDTVFVRVIRFEGVDFPKHIADSLIAQRTQGRPTDYVQAFRSAVYVPPLYPPVEDVLIGQDDRLWLKLHTDGNQQEYLVLSPGGELVETVVFPRRTTVRAAKGPIVWALQFSEFDVADIVRYEL